MSGAVTITATVLEPGGASLNTPSTCVIHGLASNSRWRRPSFAVTAVVTVVEVGVEELKTVANRLSVNVLVSRTESLINQKSRVLTTDAVIRLCPATDLGDLQYPKGKALAQVSTTIEAHGDPGNWPFDTYTTDERTSGGNNLGMDFDKLLADGEQAAPIEPRELFASLPNKAEGYGYLRDGQGQVLSASRDSAWRVHVSARWAKTRISDLKATDVQAWIAQLSTDPPARRRKDVGLKAEVIETCLTVLSGILDDCFVGCAVAAVLYGGFRFFRFAEA